MKKANNIHIRVFFKKQENEEQIINTLKKIIGYSDEELRKEKIEIKKTEAKGFEEKIKINEIVLNKDRHMNHFLKILNTNLNKKDKELLIKQENRIDENYDFFLRISKQQALENIYELTDSGDCYHIKINLACHPKNKELAKEKIKEIFF